MSKMEGSSSLWVEGPCGKFNGRPEGHCGLCGWEKMDHPPLNQLQVITEWANGGINLSELQARCHVRDLLAMLGEVKAKTQEWHDAYTEANKLGASGGKFGTINDFDDAGHEIDTILSEVLDAPVPGTGGMWAIKINEGQLHRHPTRFSALFSANAARQRGEHVEVYAEIYPDGKSHWELQPL